jgi:hypothetical protein
VGDFNGDGKADILWRHSSGLVYVWLMDGTTIIGEGSPASMGTDWTSRGGDFNGDSKADPLAPQPGDLSTWFMNGTSLVAASGGARLAAIPRRQCSRRLPSERKRERVGNNAKTNGGRGFNLSGSGNVLNTNKAERSAGPEFTIGPNNVDDGNNSANGTRFSFPAAGGTFE